MTDELTPVRCGCGGEAKVISYLSREYCKMAYYVRCVECGTETDDLHSEAEAIMAWNKAMGERTAKVIRKTLEEDVKFGSLTFRKGTSFLCQCCGCGLYVRPDDNYCVNCGAKLDWSGNE